MCYYLIDLRNKELTCSSYLLDHVSYLGVHSSTPVEAFKCQDADRQGNGQFVRGLDPTTYVPT